MEWVTADSVFFPTPVDAANHTPDCARVRRAYEFAEEGGRNKKNPKINNLELDVFFVDSSISHYEMSKETRAGVTAAFVVVIAAKP